MTTSQDFTTAKGRPIVDVDDDSSDEKFPPLDRLLDMLWEERRKKREAKEAKAFTTSKAADGAHEVACDDPLISKRLRRRTRPSGEPSAAVPLFDDCSHRATSISSANLGRGTRAEAERKGGRTGIRRKHVADFDDDEGQHEPEANRGHDGNPDKGLDRKRRRTNHGHRAIPPAASPPRSRRANGGVGNAVEHGPSADATLVRATRGGRAGFRPAPASTSRGTLMVGAYNKIGAANSKRLEQGHPLSTLDPDSLHTMWKRHGGSGGGPAHDLAQPSQEPSFVYQPDVPSARLPDCARPELASRPSDLGEQLSALKDKFRTKRNIVLITGAGVSTHAGIPDFRSSSCSKASSRNVYDASAYSTPESAEQLHADVLHKLRSGLTAPLTSFDTFLDRLAQSDHLRRQYTQNIDCRHTRAPFLAQRTMWLHGRADTLVCHLRPSHTRRVTPRSFRRWALAPCPSCKREQKKQVMAGKRTQAVGFLRSRVLLYGEHCPDESEITAAFNSDLKEPIDAVLIVGTRLSIPSIADFAKRICEVVAENPENLVVWVSKGPPKLDDGFRSHINYEYLGDCDDFALMMSR